MNVHKLPAKPAKKTGRPAWDEVEVEERHDDTTCILCGRDDPDDQWFGRPVHKHCRDIDQLALQHPIV